MPEKKEIRGVAKDFSPWLPLETQQVSDSGEPIWRGVFPSEDTVTLWALRKFIHWEVAIDRLQVFAASAPNFISPGAALINTSSLQFAYAPGVFEYLITDPTGHVVMWQRIHLTLYVVWMIEGVIGIPAVSFFVWNSTDDKSYAYRSRRVYEGKPNTNPTLGPPTVLALKDTYTYYTGEVLVRYNGIPVDDAGTPVNTLFVERAAITPEELERPDLSPLTYTTVGSMTLVNPGGPTNHAQDYFTYTETLPSHGDVYVYRVRNVASTSFSDGISVVSFGKSEYRTRIETFVFDGQPTTLNEDVTIDGSSRIAYTDYADKVWFPKNREETLYLDPASGTDVTVDGGLVDTWWNSPIYQVDIPPGSILTLKRDFFGIPGPQDTRVRNKQWQFSYKTEPQMWNVIKSVAGRMVQGQAIVDAKIIESQKYELGQSAVGSKVLVTFPYGQGALLYENSAGDIHCLLITNSGTKLYVSSNGGRDFHGIYDNTGNLYTLFNGDKSHRPTDLIVSQNSQDVFILTESAGNIYFDRSGPGNQTYTSPIFLGKKQVTGEYKFTNYQDGQGMATLMVGCKDHYFISTNGGYNWTEGGTIVGSANSSGDLPFNGDESFKILDSHKTKTGKLIYLAERGNHLFIDEGSKADDHTIHTVGEKVTGNSYRLETYTPKMDTGVLGIVGNTHRLLSSDGGRQWTSQNIYDMGRE